MLDLPEHALEDEPIFTAADLLAQRWSKGRAPKDPAAAYGHHVLSTCCDRRSAQALSSHQSRRFLRRLARC